MEHVFALAGGIVAAHRNAHLRMELIAAGRALVHNVPAGDTRPLQVIQPGDRVYLLDFKLDGIELIRTGEFVEFEVPREDQRDLRIKRTGPPKQRSLACFRWDAESLTEGVHKHPTERIGLELSPNSTLLMVRSLDDISGITDCRQARQRSAFPVTLPTS